MTIARDRLRLAALAMCLLAPVSRAPAHPLGNDSVAHINILWILPDRLEFDLFLDFAEGPSRSYPEQIDADNDGEESTREQSAWLLKKAAQIAPLIHATIDGETVPLVVPEEARDPNSGKAMPSIPGLIKIPGAAGQPTYRALIRFTGRFAKPLTPGEHTLHFEDTSFPEFNGLKRIVLEHVPGVNVIPPHPAFLDPEGSAFLYDQYDPSNLPSERKATMRFRIEGREQNTGSAPAKPGETAGPPLSTNPSDLPYPILDPRNDPARNSVANQQAQRLIGKLQGPWGVMTLLTITALAFGWGAAHALMPGHAKTVVAAYLISQRGNYWHAVALAVIVTITHTALVVIVGVIIWLYQKSHPTLGASLQLWLGIIAGLLVAGMGLTLVWRALTGRIAHHHHDEHDHAGERSWFRRLFTHSHPHVHQHPAGVEHGHGHPHPHSHQHDHSHDHGHSHENEHSHGHSHAHGHPHDHPHEHGPGHSHSHHHDLPGGHSHDQGHSHDHGHDHTHGHSKSAVDQPLTVRMLLLLGITGGIVPCPTAMIILLLGISTNVVAGGVYAVGVFSLGLALTLMLIGFAALASRRFAARIMADAGHEGELSSSGQRILLQVIPTLSGLAVTLLGIAIAANYAHYLWKGSSLLPWLG